MFQRIPVSIFHGNQGLPQVAYNNTSIYSPSFADIGSTLTAPMQFRQHASNNPILSALLIFQLSEAMIHIQNKNLGIHLYTEDNIKLLNLLKNIDYGNLKEYVYSILKPLVEYEQKNSTPLIDTLYKHIECKFNAKDTAEKLFIHYNTVRYRLDVIEQLGFSVLSNKESHFDLYFALYLYKNFEPGKN